MKRLWPALGLVVGCTDPAVGTTTAASTGVGSTGSASSTSDGPSSSGSTTSANSSGSSSGGADASSNSSTGEALEGPGCGVVPKCEDRTITGSVRVESVDDLSELEGAHEISGTLEIAGSDLECLDALACLRIVGGDVRIQSNPVLRSTAGLRNVEALGVSEPGSAPRSVIVTDNEALDVLEGFDGTQSIDGGLTIWHNASLREIVGFTGLRGLPLLSINDNPVLESLAGLHDVVQLFDCNVNNNATLCISEVFEVCGDLEEPADGVTNNNDDGC